MILRQDIGRHGGRYTKPRRGWRSKSHYPERLKRRGLTSAMVHMESLDTLRKRQGDSLKAPRIKGGIPSAPVVPINAQQWKGGKVYVGQSPE
jgi:hypothetical protein